MNTNHFLKAIIVMMVLFTIPFIANAQRMRKSPHDTVTAVIGGANMKIVYGSPAVNGRVIWGELVPYDKAWRGGADEATLFTTDKAITIQGKSLPAGTYSIFVIPGKDSWTYIFNSQTGQWGIKRGGLANFDESKNVLTVTAKPQAADMTEHLKYIFGANSLGLRWEKLEALFTIQ